MRAARVDPGPWIGPVKKLCAAREERAIKHPECLAPGTGIEGERATSTARWNRWGSVCDIGPLLLFFSLSPQVLFSNSWSSHGGESYWEGHRTAVAGGLRRSRIFF